MEHIRNDPCCSAAETQNMPRSASLKRALRLEYLTVGWNTAEGVIAVSAAIAAGSVALLGFGLDSFVESSAGGVMIWRLLAEARGRVTRHELEAIEQRARRLVAGSLFLLAAYVFVDATQTLWTGDRPEFSAIGVALTGVSLCAMWWLAREKRTVAAQLGSRAMEADAFQTTACWWLSLAALVGVGLNGAFGWWWADPAAALIIAGLIVKEAREAWAGESDCC